MDERLWRELQEQASRNTQELVDARAAFLREQEAAVAAAVTATALQLKAVKAVEDKAHAAMTARLEVRGALRQEILEELDARDGGGRVYSSPGHKQGEFVMTQNLGVGRPAQP